MKSLILCSKLSLLFFLVTTKVFSQNPTDINGNTYSTIQIGTQIWFAENLKVKNLNDGTPIEYISSQSDWELTTGPAYCWLENDSLNKELYGAIYNFNIAKSTNICPTGWHVPSDQDWLELEVALGMSNEQADSMYWRGEEIGVLLKSQEGWLDGGNGNNQSGFNGMPGGYRMFDGEMGTSGDYIVWWSSTANAEGAAITRELNNGDHYIGRIDSEPQKGAYIRCVKD